MARYIQVEREPECRLFDVPIIAAGAVADALCCQGPRRDFATEQDFRLRNAAKLYPAGYTLGSPYAYDSRVQYAPAPYRHLRHAVPPPVREAPPVVRLERRVEPTYYPPYPTETIPQPLGRVYRYEQDAYIHLPREIVPPVTPRIERPIAEPTKTSWVTSKIERPIPEQTKTNWESHLSTSSYQHDRIGPPPQFVLTTSSTQPGNTPRDDLFVPSWPGTVEIIKMEERTLDKGPEVDEDGEKPEPEKASNKNVQEEGKPESEQSPGGAPRGHGSRKKGAAKKDAHLSKPLDRPQKDQRQKKDGEEASPSPRLPSGKSASPQRMDGEVPAPQDENEQTPEQEQEARAASAASTSQAAATEVAKQERAAGGKAEKDAEAGESKDKDVPATKEGKEQKPEQKQEGRQEEAIDDSGAASSEDPIIPEEGERQVFDEGSLATNRTKVTDEDMKQDMPLFSMTFSAATFANPDITVPRMVKVVGEPLPPQYEAANNETDSRTGWPVGYVPPADDKYRELAVGNQVYLEGGTFFLTETGAYLLGLRG